MSTTRYRTIDGDTVEDLNTGEDIRLKGGANTPEVAHKVGEVTEPGGRAATDAMRQAVALGYAPDGGDEYDKHARGLQTFSSPEGADLSAGLVGAGLAVPHINPEYLDEAAIGLGQYSQVAARNIYGTDSPLMQDPTIRLLADEARRERHAAFNNWVKSGAGLDSSGFAGERRDLKYNENFFEGENAIMDRALARGTDNLHGMYYGFANALGEVIGSEKVAQMGADGMARNLLQALENPATIASYEDAHTASDWFIYAAEAVGEQLPQFAADLGVAAATMGGSLSASVLAGAGKAAMRNIGGSMLVASAPKMAGSAWTTALTAGKLGAAGSMYAQLVGETQGQFKAEGIDNPGLALALGAPKLAMDYLGLHTVLSQGLKGLGGKAVTGSGLDILKRALGSTATAFSVESLTEGAQILTDELAVAAQKPGYEVNAKHIIDGMLKGGFAGGGIAGGTQATLGTLQLAMQQPKNTDPVTDTDAESSASIKAQLNNMPAGKTRYFTAANAEAALAAAREAGKVARTIQGGHVQVANTKEELDALPTNPTEADNAAILGYVQTKEEALADPGGVQAVVVRDEQGVVVESQVVGASRADEAVSRYQEQYPNLQVEVTTPEAVIAERRQAIQTEKVQAVDAPGGLRAAPAAKRGKVAGPKGNVPEQKKVEPSTPKLPPRVPDISDPAQAGVNVDLIEGRADYDRGVLNRMLVSRLQSRPGDSRDTLAKQLGDRKVRELSDKEARDYARQFGIDLDALPRAKGVVENNDGKVGDSVNKAYRTAAARSLLETLKQKIRDGKLRADLTPLAEFLGMEPGMAQRSAYDSTEAYREAISQALNTKYGTLSAVAKGLNEGGYTPSEVSDLLAAVGAAEPTGFKFKADAKVSDAAVKAVVAQRLPTMEANPHPDKGEAPLTAAQEQQVVESAKGQARIKRAVGIIDTLRAHPTIGRFFTPGERGNNRAAKLTGLFGVGKEAQGLREAAIAAMNEAGVDTKQGLESLIDYTEALIETARLWKHGSAIQVVQDGEAEDGAAPDTEVVASEEIDEDQVKVRELTAIRDQLRHFQKKGLKLTTTSKKGLASGAKSYMMVLSQLAQHDDIEDVDVAEPLLGEKGQKAMREVTVLSAAIYALGDAGISPSNLKADLLEVTGLTDEDLSALTLVTPDGAPITAEAAIDGVADTANKLSQAARNMMIGQVAPDGDPDAVALFFGNVIENLKSDKPAARQLGLRSLMGALLWVDLDKLQAADDMRRMNSDGSKPASGKGIYDSVAQDKSEQQMSDWTFFGAMRRARAFFRAPWKLRKKDNWRRKQGEPSIFDTHNTWVIDFETFFDTEQGYSLGAMDQDAYIQDPRFAIHGMAVTAKGEKTRYLTSMADIQAFIGELKASDKPVALVGHNARFDADVMAKVLGFEPAMWVNTLELSRLAMPEETVHTLGAVAQRLGMHKPIESLAATDGKKNLAEELTAEEAEAFADYARGDADVTLAFLEQNEPSVEFAQESGAALNVARGVAGLSTLTVESFDFGDPTKPGVAKSMEVTRLVGGRNLLMIPHHDTKTGRYQELPFDAVAMGEFSQSGNKKAETAAEAAANLMDAISRMVMGPESSDVGVGMQAARGFVPHDDTVIFIDPQKGAVTYGQAIAGQRGMQGRETALAGAEKSQAKLRERLEEVNARLQGIAATLYEAMEDEASGLREAAMEIWLSRIAGEIITDADIEANNTSVGKGTALLAEVNKIGRNTNAEQKDGMKLSLADNYSEKLSIMGELARAGATAKKAKAEGARGDVLDDEQAARIALAEEANALLAKHGNVDQVIKETLEQLDKLSASRGKKGGAKKREARLAKMRELNLKLDLAVAAKEWARSDGWRVYPSDIPQHAVDSMLRGDGFAEIVVTEAVEYKETQAADGVHVQGAAEKLTDNPTQEQGKYDPDAYRKDGVEHRGTDEGLARLYEQAGEGGRVGDMVAAIQARGGETRMDSRVFDTPRDTAPAPAKKAAAPGPKAETDPDARAPGKKTPVLGFENKLGEEFGFLAPFLARLRELNVPLDNVTLLSRQSATALRRANQNTELGQLLAQLVNGDGSAYFSHNGRSYVLIGRDPSEKAAALEDLAHELGHVAKDRVWADLLAEDRAALEAEFANAHPTAVADDVMLHEWFADQFMRAVIRQVSKAKGPNAQEQAASGFARKIAELLNIIRNIWGAVSKTGELSVGFEQFAQRLFSGGYRGVGVSAPATSSIYYASGADMLSQTEANRLQMGVNKVKQGWKKGVVPSLRNVMGTVIGQIEAIDKQLANMLFQRANADSNGGRAYEQTHAALAQRMMAEKDKLMASLSSAKGKKRTAEIQAALGDAFTGSPKTEAGKRARAGLDRLAQLAAKEGLKTVPMEDGFPIAVFDREAVERNRAAFVAKLVEKLGVSSARAGEIYLGIVEGTGSLEGAIAPGLPVGMHISTREILAKIPYTELRDAGWLLQEHEAALQHWVGGVAKRAAWEKTFGGFTMGNAQAMAQQLFGEPDPEGTRLMEAGMLDAEGRVFNPNAKFHEALNRIRKTSGEQAAQRVLDLLDGVMGRTGANMPQGLRKAQDFVMAFVNLLTLGFSGLHSIPELGTPLVRAGGRVGLTDMLGSIDEGRRLAEALGFVLSDASQRIVWQATGEQYQSPFAQKMNYWLFKLNMNQKVTNMARTFATGVGVQYLLKSVADGDNAALARLNIDAATVRAWESLGKQAPSVGQNDTVYAINARVADALSQFVSEATIAPSRFQATHWGNNPMFKIVWHLKHFMWAYGDTVLGGMWRDAKRRFKDLDGPAFNRALAAAAPAMIFGLVMMPLAAAALELRDWLRRSNNTRVEERTATEYMAAMFDRAGGLGPLSFVAGAYKAQAEYGTSVFGSLSPTLGKVDMLFTDYKKDGEINKAEMLWKVRQMTPIWSQNKTMFGLLE